MAVDSVSINTALDQQSKTNAAASQLSTDFNDFLILLTTQLQYQDPLSPMDTTEFTNQLVGFAGVEQQINTNQKLDSLVSLGLGNALGTAQNYVGKEISYVSSEFSYTGEPSKIRYSLNSEAVSSKISIYDESGKVVYSVEAAKSPGAHEFIWDGTLNNGGKAESGTYEIKVDALDAAGEAITSTTVVTGLVRGTEAQDGQIYLLVGERAVALGNVLNTSNNGSSSTGDGLTMALSYVGLDVTYTNDEIFWNSSDPVAVNYTLENTAAQSKIIIKNSTGQTVYTADASKVKGSHSFTWNGQLQDGTTAPAGEYTVTVDSIDSNDQRIATKVIAGGRVTGVETNNGETYLVVGGQSIPLINILSANVPEEA